LAATAGDLLGVGVFNFHLNGVTENLPRRAPALMMFGILTTPALISSGAVRLRSDIVSDSEELRPRLGLTGL
jgi:MFS superfamily sulfate permease-like transporter